MPERLCFKIQRWYFQHKSVVLRVFFGIWEFNVGVDPGYIMTSHCNQDFIFLGQFFLFFGWETEKTDSNLPQAVDEACRQSWRQSPDLLHADLLNVSHMATLSLHLPSPHDSQCYFLKLKWQYFTMSKRLSCLVACLAQLKPNRSGSLFTLHLSLLASETFPLGLISLFFWGLMVNVLPCCIAFSNQLPCFLGSLDILGFRPHLVAMFSDFLLCWDTSSTENIMLSRY